MYLGTYIPSSSFIRVIRAILGGFDKMRPYKACAFLMARPPFVNYKLLLLRGSGRKDTVEKCPAQ